MIAKKGITMKKNEIRQRKVLNHLIEEYIGSIEAVSSKVICEKYVSNASPATIRIDLNKLEKANFIYQPHTSAGRIPTIMGYREYLKHKQEELDTIAFDNSELLRDLLIKHYRDTAMGLHFIMQLLARETDQLSFVAEPEVSLGILSKLDVFRISPNKLLFVVSLDSGLDKTVIIRCDHGITQQQLKTIVRYVNDEFVGRRIFDIQNKYIDETSEKISKENKLIKLFLDELRNAINEISSFYIHFDGNITFLEQPEFDDKKSILSFLGFMQRQDHLINLMQKYDNREGCGYCVLMGEELGYSQLTDYTLIYAKYEIFGIPGYLGILGPKRMDYMKNIPIIRDFAKVITETTKKGMVVLKNDKK